MTGVWVDETGARRTSWEDLNADEIRRFYRYYRDVVDVDTSLDEMLTGYVENRDFWDAVVNRHYENKSRFSKGSV